MDAGGTSPWMGESRTMQEQLSRVTQERLPSDSVIRRMTDLKSQFVTSMLNNSLTSVYSAGKVLPVRQKSRKHIVLKEEKSQCSS